MLTKSDVTHHNYHALGHSRGDENPALIKDNIRGLDNRLRGDGAVPKPVLRGFINRHRLK